MPRKLNRSTTDRKIWGVCGGLADYFRIDPVIVRVIFVLLIFANGLGVLLYIILAIVTPSAPQTPGREPAEQAALPLEEVTQKPRGSSTSGAVIVGIVLVAVGFIMLVSTLGLFSWLRWTLVVPVILILIGLLLFVGRGRR